MKQMFNITLGALILVTALGISSNAWAKSAKPASTEQKLSQADLPAVVMTTLQKNFPMAMITQVTKETENKVDVYDVETKDGEIERDLLFKLDGTLIEIGEHINVSELPVVVSAAALNAYPKSSIEKAERKTINGVLNYDVTVESHGESYELLLSPSGSVLSSAGEADDDDESEDDGDDD